MPSCPAAAMTARTSMWIEPIMPNTMNLDYKSDAQTYQTSIQRTNLGDKKYDRYIFNMLPSAWSSRNIATLHIHSLPHLPGTLTNLYITTVQLFIRTFDPYQRAEGSGELYLSGDVGLATRERYGSGMGRTNSQLQPSQD